MKKIQEKITYQWQYQDSETGNGPSKNTDSQARLAKREEKRNIRGIRWRALGKIGKAFEGI